MRKLFIELKVSEEVAEILIKYFDAIENIFETNAKEIGYNKVSLTVTEFKASSENAMVIVSDPYLRSNTDGLRMMVLNNWIAMRSLLQDEEIGIGIPTILFSQLYEI